MRTDYSCHLPAKPDNKETGHHYVRNCEHKTINPALTVGHPIETKRTYEALASGSVEDGVLDGRSHIFWGS